ncbi:copper radical oxidase [Mycena galopus ATCC 62051]|nr:copper radical oxidase [Mycena galopus ATCC 62051]
MALHTFSLLVYALATLCSIVSAVDSAWNGHTPPGSTGNAAFLPYYVPPGAKGYDSVSPLILYSGGWKEMHSQAYVGNSLQQTSQTGAHATLSFRGCSIEWFGNCGPDQCIADVLIDGVLVQKVDPFCNEGHKQQRIYWNYALSSEAHTVKINSTGARPGSTRPCFTSLDAFVVTQCPNRPSTPSAHHYDSPSLVAKAESDEKWTLEQKGSTGVHAMQLAVISSTHALIVDKVEHNPLTLNGHPAWGALYNLQTHAVTALSIKSNSFCAGGTFLSNGTMIVVGGNPVVENKTSPADFGDVNGLQAIRLLECDSPSVERCQMYENPSRIRMASSRWYNTVIRMPDGSAMMIGGSKKGGWINNATVNNPTVEYFPSKGMPVNLAFLVDTLNSNLFPIAFVLPDGTVFMAANNDAMIYNWKDNSERRLPSIPNGVRVTYPMAATSLLLPLSPSNNYEPEILICGGSTISDTKPSYQLSSQAPASAQCTRMILTEDGITKGWETEEMPEARLMPDAVLLPTGEVLIVNGARTGISGYGNVLDQVGASNADNPVFQPVLYNPSAPNGSRFSTAGLPASPIPRLYHSVATLVPDGRVMIAGSNPNLDRSAVMYGTEYRVEWLSPPYMTKERPQLENVPKQFQLDFGKTITITVILPSNVQGKPDVKVAIMDFGYVTHAVHANSRMVYLVATLAGTSLTITGPPNGNVYPPGPGWLVFVVNGVPSIAERLIVGDGKSPKVDKKAMESVLENTSPDQYDESKSGDGGEE